MIELRCGECNSDLEIIYGQSCIVVQLCRKCRQELYNLAYEDGFEEGKKVIENG